MILLLLHFYSFVYYCSDTSTIAMIPLLLQWYFYFCSDTSTIAIIPLRLQWYYLYDTSTTVTSDCWCVSCSAMICAKHVCHMCCNTSACKLSHQEYCHGFNLLHSINNTKYWNVLQNIASEMTESIVRVGGQSWHLYSLLDTVPYSQHITILRTALLTCRHLYSLLRGRWRAADCRRSGLTLTLQTVNSDMLL